MKHVAMGLALLGLLAACGAAVPTVGVATPSVAPTPTVSVPARSDEGIDKTRCNPVHNVEPCMTPAATQPAPTAHGAGAGTVVLAPIETVEVIATPASGSLAPQYALRIVSGLPNGCARFDAITWERLDTTFRVRVTNRVPEGPDVVCTQVYGYVEHTVELGGGLAAGTAYTVDVNGVTRTFRA